MIAAALANLIMICVAAFIVISIVSSRAELDKKIEVNADSIHSAGLISGLNAVESGMLKGLSRHLLWEKAWTQKGHPNMVSR
jgi:hypothetical protein